MGDGFARVLTRVTAAAGPCYRWKASRVEQPCCLIPAPEGGAHPYRSLAAGSSTYTVILEAEITHRFRLEQIAAIKDQRRLHQTPDLREVHSLGILPFLANDHSFCVSDGLERSGN